MARTVCFIVRPEMTLQDIIVAMLMAKGGVCLDGMADCLTYCVSRNDSLGHYRCDVNGRRKCLFGWHGSYCLTYCVPSNDSLGHYICGSNGQKSCLDYWYGTNCLIYCKPGIIFATVLDILFVCWDGRENNALKKRYQKLLILPLLLQYVVALKVSNIRRLHLR